MLGRPLAAAGLDDVGVERALHQELDRLAVRLAVGDHLAGRLLEYPDELAADDLALLLGVGDAGQRVEEPVGRLDDLEAYAGRRDEILLDLLGLALAQQAVVDEDARQPVADRALDQSRGDGGVDAAGEAADRPLAADLRADPLDLLVDDVDHRPRRPAAGTLVQEVLEHVHALGAVQHLRVELHAVQPLVVVLEHGDRRAVGRRGDGEAGRRIVTLSPWLIQTGAGPAGRRAAPRAQ
jgi:hypothetical protein